MHVTSSMSATAEKRKDPRTPIQAVISYFPFSTQQNVHCDGTALNAGQNGLYFETPHPLKNGQYICIRIKEVLSDAVSANLRTLTLAQVRWCTAAGSSNSTCYGAGVQYC